MDRIHVMNLVTSYQHGQLSRRQFLRRAGIAVGSISVANMLLAACQTVPLNAPPSTMLTTPEAAPEAVDAEAGMAEGMVTYGEGDALSGYLALPADGATGPAVIVIQEWWGLNDHIKDLADRFAAEGYVALAPDLYKGAVATEPDEARKLVMELDMAQAVVEIGTAIDFLLAHEGVTGEKVGVIGYCMGGGLVLQTAVANDKVGAAIPYYGTLLTPAEAAQVKAPVQSHYGSADRFDLNALQEMTTIIQEEAGQPAEAYVYDDAPHAFFNDTAESYRPEAAAEAWERTLAWFEEHLG